MNSRINAQEGFSIPPGQDSQILGSWIPVTPEKQIPSRSNSFPSEIYGNPGERPNRPGQPEFTGANSDRAPYGTSGTTPYFNLLQQSNGNGGYYHPGAGLTERNGLINPSAGSYAQAVCSETRTLSYNQRHNLSLINNAGMVNRTYINNTGMLNMPLTQNQNPPVSSNWRETDLEALLLSDETPCSFSSLLSGEHELLQIPQYGFPMPNRPFYNLNSPWRPVADNPSSVASSGQFTPLTPNQDLRSDSTRHSEVLDASMHDRLKIRKECFENTVTTFNNGTAQNSDELLQKIVDPSDQSDAIKKGAKGIDLNKTPQQKPPKRRKHRPKVVIEGTRKRAPKPKNPTEPSLKEKPSGKRKYVRKKSLKGSAPQQSDDKRETAEPSPDVTAKSCRRALNFEMEEPRQGEGCHEKAPMTDVVGNNSLPYLGHSNEQPKRDQQLGTVGSYSSSLYRMIADNTSLPQRTAEPSNALVTDLLHMEILNNITRHVGTRVEQHQQTSRTEHCSLRPERQKVGFSVENCEVSDMPARLTHRTSSMVLSRAQESRGSKREYQHAMVKMQQYTSNTTASLTVGQEISGIELERDSNNVDASSLAAYKKKKIRNEPHGSMSCMHPPLTRVDSDGNIYGFNSRNDHETSNSMSITIKTRGSSADSRLPAVQGAESVSYRYKQPKQNRLPKPKSATEYRAKPQDQSFTNNEKGILDPPTPPRLTPATGNHQLVPMVSTSTLTKLNIPSESTSSGHKKPKGEQSKLPRKVQQSERKNGTSRQQPYTNSVDELIHRLENLKLNDENTSALIPYQGDGAIVPFDGLEFLKKRKPRPKVDLDDETTRIWNLLMGKVGNEADQGLDKEKEKWWEEQRRVFRGRADSFIARMHLVQGDRRFSPWKGSVVDSVIGVFLTQNVSDHLSSSAFISLASRFPVKPKRYETLDGDTTSTFVERPLASTPHTIDIIQSNSKAYHPTNCQGSMVESGLKEPRDSPSSGIDKAYSAERRYQNLEEEVLSSQDSFDPSVLQPIGVGSSSASNSDAEFSTTRCESNTACGPIRFPFIVNGTLCDELYSQGNRSPVIQSGSNHGHMQGATATTKQNLGTNAMENFNYSSLFGQQTDYVKSPTELTDIPTSISQFHMTSQPQLLDIEDFGKHAGEDIYSWLSLASGGEKQNNLSKKTGNAVGQLMATRFSASMIQATGLWEFTNKQRLSKENTQAGSRLQYDQPSNSKQELNKNFWTRSTPVRKQKNSAEKSATRPSSTVWGQSDIQETNGSTLSAEEGISQVNKNRSCESKLIESNSINQEHVVIEEYKEKNSGSSRTKKVKPDDQKRNTVDWDSLRRQVRSNGRTERSNETMDSIDYEALRNANVSEISEAIKERGMNNMLAERIKEFLNRLVREHGSTDLEWLRDIPPDKAKDYLLSIRGLGLKSVECVRLLTLHHLAFPVDTNVGRIAVRLGWVPLQPLPESLQLHLLELYPVLESIQKYLWPRLCKLDQRTLYELHYQLITFGKVFCTKSKPNCNACPMRGECRHFASAFASARLALPGPEEKSVTAASVPTMADAISTPTVPPMQLPQPEKNLPTVENIRNCEPIIEEPATPEEEVAKVSESDIEDSLYEDPDEIPMIKLNIEEFTSNLQQYMERNMELQEVDMSKALVALDPTAASLPTTKLKNISRLRTEHQVYELPESHPLLERLEKREPDDPSPYLLAIWTPGETANSSQPPEKKCELQESGSLCTNELCLSCNTIRETNSLTVRGTLLIPCRTAMRGSFPLNGTYFQVNEVFADHETSLTPISVPREWIWNLPRRIVYFGTSVTSIFRGLSTEQIQYCFWKGFVCVRGFDRENRAPRPLMARLHFPASKLAKTKNESKR